MEQAPSLASLLSIRDRSINNISSLVLRYHLAAKVMVKHRHSMANQEVPSSMTATTNLFTRTSCYRVSTVKNSKGVTTWTKTTIKAFPGFGSTLPISQNHFEAWALRLNLSSSRGTVVEPTPRKQKLKRLRVRFLPGVGLFISLSSASLIRSLKEMQHYRFHYWQKVLILGLSQGQNKQLTCSELG